MAAREAPATKCPMGQTGVLPRRPVVAVRFGMASGSPGTCPHPATRIPGKPDPHPLGRLTREVDHPIFPRGKPGAGKLARQVWRSGQGKRTAARRTPRPWSTPTCSPLGQIPADGGSVRRQHGRDRDDNPDRLRVPGSPRSAEVTVVVDAGMVSGPTGARSRPPGYRSSSPPRSPKSRTWSPNGAASIPTSRSRTGTCSPSAGPQAAGAPLQPALA